MISGGLTTKPSSKSADVSVSSLTKRGLPCLIVVAILCAAGFVIGILMTLFGDFRIDDLVLIGLWVVVAVASLLETVICLFDIWRSGAVPREQRWSWTMITVLVPMIGAGLYWSEHVRHRPVGPA